MKKKQLTIAIYHTDFSAGGVEKVMITYANMLAKLGYKVFAIETRHGKLDCQFSEKVQLINLNVKRFRYSVIKTVKIFKELEVDLVFCANINTLFIEIAKLFSNSRMKIVSSHHFYCNNSEMKWYLVRGLKYIYKRCDIVLAVSDGIKRELLHNIGVSPNKVQVLKNPIDISEIEKKSLEFNVCTTTSKSIIWCGRFTSVKNIPLLIEAFEKFHNIYPDYYLYLIGDGPDKLKIEYIVNQKGLGQYVVFTGMQTNPFPYIKRADLVCLSSESEAYPTILLESLALGKTIISTPTSGAVEILDNGRLGYISKNYSVNEFLHVMLKGIEHPFDSNYLRVEAEKSDVAIVTEELINVFNKVML